MSTSMLLLTAMTLSAPPTVPNPRLERGLEIRWSGTFTEASLRPGVRSSRTYDVDTRMFVLEVNEKGSEVALFTRVFTKPDRRGSEMPAGVVRIELARIDPQGGVLLIPSSADYDRPKSAAPRPWPAVQLQGLPSHEASMFVPLPEGTVGLGKQWTREEAGRPTVEWKVVDVDSVRGQPSMRIIAKQHTPGYYGARTTKPEWRRQDTVAVLQSLGIAGRWERVIERREADSEDMSFRSVLSMEYQNKLTYSGRLYQERREEVLNAAAFTAVLDRQLADGGRGGPAVFTALVKRINDYQAENVGSDTVPYREAVTAVRKRAESAAKGNLPPTTPADPTNPADSAVIGEGKIAIGRPIPDIVTKSLDGAYELQLSKLRGKPLLLVYFQPTSTTAGASLRSAQHLQNTHRNRLAVLPLAIGEVRATVQLAVDNKAPIPIYDGNGVYKAHGLESTPVIILVDGEGIVRSVMSGWGTETPELLAKELGKILK